MLDIVCLPCEHDIDSLRLCLILFLTDGEPGPPTGTLSGSRVSGLSPHQPQSRDGSQVKHTEAVCPWGSLVLPKWQRRSVPPAEGRGVVGDGWVTAPWECQ